MTRIIHESIRPFFFSSTVRATPLHIIRNNMPIHQFSLQLHPRSTEYSKIDVFTADPPFLRYSTDAQKLKSPEYVGILLISMFTQTKNDMKKTPQNVWTNQIHRNFTSTSLIINRRFKLLDSCCKTRAFHRFHQYSPDV